MKNIICENKIYCGDFTDIQVYPCFTIASLRGKKKKVTTDIQQKLNDDNSKKKLMRLIHTNFTSKDYALHLTYNDSCYPESVQRAKKDIQNYIKRLKRYYIKHKINEIKYIWVLESGKISGRLHFHMIISGRADRTAIEELWGKGYANTKALQFTSKGIAGLSHYISKQGLLYRAWSCSKNLKKPRVRTNKNLFTFSDVKKLYEARENIKEFKKIYPRYGKIFENYDISEITAQHNSENGGYYFTVRLYRTDKKYIKWIE